MRRLGAGLGKGYFTLRRLMVWLRCRRAVPADDGIVEITMAEMRFSIRVLPVGVVVAALMLSGCEREISTGGDPRVDGIIQTALPEPDLSILGDQRNTKSTARMSAVPAAPASAPATTPGTVPVEAPAGGSSQPAAGALDSPEAAIRELMMAMAAKDQGRINRATLEMDGREVLAEGPTMPPEALKQMNEELVAVKFTPLKVGDTVNLPGGKSVTVDATMVDDTHQQLTGTDVPVPFMVERMGKEWKVNAGPLIAARKGAAAARKRTADGAQPNAGPAPAQN